MTVCFSSIHNFTLIFKCLCNLQDAQTAINEMNGKNYHIGLRVVWFPFVNFGFDMLILLMMHLAV